MDKVYLNVKGEPLPWEENLSGRKCSQCNDKPVVKKGFCSRTCQDKYWGVSSKPRTIPEIRARLLEWALEEKKRKKVDSVEEIFR